MSECTHAGFVYWNHDSEEWYCRRCAETLAEPPAEWDDEDIKAAKESL